MIVAIHQPNLLPRLKVIQKLALADLWIVLDDVQFNRRDYQHRAFVAPAQASQECTWLTLPVRLPSGRTTKIREVQLVETDPVRRVSNKLLASFGRSIGLSDLLRGASMGFDAKEPLTSLGIATTRFFLDLLTRQPQLVLASELRSSAARSSAGIVQLCRLVDAKTYIADSGAVEYLQQEALAVSGIGTLWQHWQEPNFPLDNELLRNGSVVNLWLREPDVCRSLMRRCMLSRDPPSSHFAGIGDDRQAEEGPASSWATSASGE